MLFYTRTRSKARQNQELRPVAMSKRHSLLFNSKSKTTVPAEE